MMHWLLLPILAMAAPAGAEGPPLREAPRVAPRAALSTAATPLFLDRCEALADSAWHCAGLPGTDVYVSQEDGRFRVALGVPETRSPTFHMPHRIGRTMEWRIDGNRAVAGIVRYRFPAPSGEGTDDLLVVIKVGSAVAPGCLVAIVDVRANNAATELAREAADAVAPRFACGSDTLEPVGRISERARDALLPSLN